LVGEVVIAIRRLIQEKSTDGVSKEQLIAYLVSIYESITVPLARASILWLVSHHKSLTHAPDCLRIALKTFKSQDSFVKIEIIILATLLYLQNPCHVFLSKAYPYTMKLASYDIDFDVRDHMRLLDGLVSKCSDNPVYTERLIKNLTQAPLFTDVLRMVPSEYRTGSLSQFFGEKIVGYIPLPDWSTEISGGNERNTTVFNF
jgi:AP-3 complex subunit beta